MQRSKIEVGLVVSGTGAGAEVLGSASPFLKVKGKELRRAAVRCVGLPDTASDSVKVEDAFAAFVGPGKMYTGAFVINKTLTCDFVRGELMARAESERLTVPTETLYAIEVKRVRRKGENKHPNVPQHLKRNLIVNKSTVQHQKTSVGLLLPRHSLLYRTHTRQRKVGHKNSEVDSCLTRRRTRNNPVQNLIMRHSY